MLEHTQTGAVYAPEAGSSKHSSVLDEWWATGKEREQQQNHREDYHTDYRKAYHSGSVTDPYGTEQQYGTDMPYHANKVFNEDEVAGADASFDDTADISPSPRPLGWSRT